MHCDNALVYPLFHPPLKYNGIFLISYQFFFTFIGMVYPTLILSLWISQKYFSLFEMDFTNSQNPQKNAQGQEFKWIVPYKCTSTLVQ